MIIFARIYHEKVYRVRYACDVGHVNEQQGDRAGYETNDGEEDQGGGVGGKDGDVEKDDNDGAVSKSGDVEEAGDVEKGDDDGAVNKPGDVEEGQDDRGQSDVGRANEHKGDGGECVGGGVNENGKGVKLVIWSKKTLMEQVMSRRTKVM